MFALQGTEMGELALPNLVIEQIDVSSAQAKFDLDLIVAETDDGLQGSLVFNPNVIACETADRLAQSWVALLQSCTAQPDSNIHALQVLDAGGLAWIKKYNDVVDAAIKPGYLHDGFLDNAVAQPDAPAVDTPSKPMV